MTSHSKTCIAGLRARQVFDSRGNPTVEVDVQLDDGSFGRAAVPSGASTGEHEALELRDGGTRYMGKGVLNAVENVNTAIRPALLGADVRDQRAVDRLLIDLDGTEDKRRLGANAILGVSMAVARAAADSLGEPLYAYIGGVRARRLPCPMFNIINGGAHADNTVDMQEFMILPTGASSLSEALRMGSEVYHHLKKVLHRKNLSTAVGDEGGFAPNLACDEDAIKVIVEAVNAAGFTLGKDFHLALDVAASGFLKGGKYFLPKQKITRSLQEMVTYYRHLIDTYPFFYSIEDPLHEDDWEGWVTLTAAIGDRVRIVGDDLYVTNIRRLEQGISRKAGNAILIKLNQIGTVSETLDAIELARRSAMRWIISHRSGETEDAFIADLAVATDAGLIKTGAPCRSDRVAKYDQLLRIEEELGGGAVYGIG